MPLSKFLSEKWDSKLYNWWLWMSTGGGTGGGSGISSIYDPKKWRRGAARAGEGFSVLSGEAKDTDQGMTAIRQAKAEGGDRVYDALVEWVKDDGTRGAQAGRLSIHQDTYKDIVDSGKRWLERLSKRRK